MGIWECCWGWPCNLNNTIFELNRPGQDMISASSIRLWRFYQFYQRLSRWFEFLKWMEVRLPKLKADLLPPVAQKVQNTKMKKLLKEKRTEFHSLSHHLSLSSSPRSLSQKNRKEFFIFLFISYLRNMKSYRKKVGHSISKKPTQLFHFFVKSWAAILKTSQIPKLSLFQPYILW